MPQQRSDVLSPQQALQAFIGGTPDARIGAGTTATARTTSHIAMAMGLAMATGRTSRPTMVGLGPSLWAPADTRISRTTATSSPITGMTTGTSNGGNSDRAIRLKHAKDCPARPWLLHNLVNTIGESLCKR